MRNLEQMRYVYDMTLALGSSVELVIPLSPFVVVPGVPRA